MHDALHPLGENPFRKHARHFAVWGDAPPPEREWLVDGLIPAGAVTFISGDGGLGKSLLAQQLMIAAALGAPWLGRLPAKVRSVALFCEDDEPEIHRRAYAIARHHGVAPGDPRLRSARFLSRVGADNALVEFLQILDRDSGERRPLWRTTRAYADLYNWAMAEEAKLIVLDSLHDFFTGNENARPEARYFVAQLRVIAQETGGAVVVLAHPSLSGLASGSGMSGSTAWNNAVRSRLYLTRPEAGEGEGADSDARLLKTMKANYSRSGEAIRLKWQDGVFSASQHPAGMVAAIERRNHEKAFLEALALATEQGRSVSDHPSAPSYAPKLLGAYPACKGIDRRRLAEIMERLLVEGRISKREVGKRSNRHPFITLAAVEGGCDA